MARFIGFFFIFGLLATFAYGQGNVRFVNAIQGVNVQIQTNLFPTISLDYTQISDYQTSNDGTVQITNILDATTGSSLIGNQPQMISFSGFYATVALVMNQGTVVCVLYNETLTAAMENGSTTSAFVRFIDLAQLNFTNLQGSGNPNSAIIFSYEGYLVNTPFAEVDPRFTSLLIVQAGTGNQWPVSTNFVASGVYTIFFFGSSGTFAGVATYDRTIPNGVSTTGEIVTPSTTGMAPATTGIATITPSPTGATGTINPQQSNSASTYFIGMSVALAAVALAF